MSFKIHSIWDRKMVFWYQSMTIIKCELRKMTSFIHLMSEIKLYTVCRICNLTNSPGTTERWII